MFPSIDPATVGFDVPLFVLMDQAMASGFKAIEFSIREMEAEISRKGKDRFLHLLKNHPIQISQFSCGTGIPSNLAVSEDRFEAAFPEWGQYCQLGKELGILQASLLVNPIKGDGYEIDGTNISKENLIERLKRLIVPAKNCGIQVVVEICDPLLLEYSKEIWENVASSHLKLLVDTFNLLKLKDPITFLNDLPIQAIGWIHAADALNGIRVLPGVGEINLYRILDLCKKKGYQGGISLEIYGNSSFDQLSLSSKLQAAKQSFIESDLGTFFK
jgi:sugar phosphate isomerase/epimerase